MTKEEIVASKYWHINNGGFTINVDKFGNIEIAFGFLGRAHASVLLMTQGGDEKFGPKEVAEFLQEAAFLIQQKQIKNLKDEIDDLSVQIPV